MTAPITDLTPSAEAVEAAARLGWHNWPPSNDEVAEAARHQARLVLTAAMPALTAQIRAATVAECQSALRSSAAKMRIQANTGVGRNERLFAASCLDAHADQVLRALLPAPENAEKGRGEG